MNGLPAARLQLKPVALGRIEEVRRETEDDAMGQTNEQQAVSGPSPVVLEAADHPIAACINTFVHRVRDHRLAARLAIPAAARSQAKELDKLVATLEHADQLLTSKSDQERILGIKTVQAAITKHNRLRRSDVPFVIEHGLFLGLFSALDAFSGDLILALYGARPDVFASLNRSVAYKDLVAASSIDELRLQLIGEEIEQFRRKSYVEQFEYLAARFDVKLTAFESWPRFVECGQRRNLMTHCDGVVSEQYIQVCRTQGVPSDELASVGETLTLGPEYFFTSCELLIEVGVKLGHTLWRKLMPEQLDQADRHLNALLYESLLAKQWKRAQMIGQFALSQRSLSSDLNRRIFTINHAQALKFGGDEAAAIKVLASMDWSAAAADFRLGEAVLRDNFTLAASIMERMGKTGELISEASYHSWPLFEQFRQTAQFAEAYAKVFGYPFVAQLQRQADETKAAAAKESPADEALLLPKESAQYSEEVDPLEDTGEGPGQDAA